MSKRVWYLFIVILFCHSFVFSQGSEKIKFGGVMPADFTVNSPLIDSTTDAVIISDIGKVYFEGNKNNNWVSYVLEKHVRIKIFNKNRTDHLTTIIIPLYGRDRYQDKLDTIQASVFNIENNTVIETSLNNTDILEEKHNRSTTIKKIPLRNVKDGSIIEYAYKITSFRYQAIPGWSFQHVAVPCLQSSFEIHIPQLLRYTMIRYGVDSFYENSSEAYKQKIIMADMTVNSVTNKHRWVMKNILPFQKETYLYDANKYADRLEFNLAQTYNGENVHNIMTDWKTVNEDLMQDKEFGLSIGKEYAVNLFNTAERACNGAIDPLDKAKRIYEYVRDNFKCVENDYITLSDDLYEINKKRLGSAAELNLLLTALLRQKDLKADPVILSTREFGVHPILYPVLDKMNYVICMLRMGSDTFYLDATKSRLGFGKIPIECYNGHASIISEKDTGSVYFITDKIKELKMISVSLHNGEQSDSDMKGTVSITPGYFDSYATRELIFNMGMEDFIKGIKTNTEIHPDNILVDSMRQYDEPVKIHYDVSINTEKEDIIYFNPFLTGRYKENPFVYADRKFPVEMKYPLNETYVLTMEIPAGYKIEELPKSTKVKFNEDEGIFEYIIRTDNKNIQLISKLVLYQSSFPPSDYQVLRDFFGYIVKKENEQFVFKKIQ